MEPATSESTTPVAVPEKKSLFEVVVTSTPVLLTVIATFMVGLSSSEMTKAQYQRSIAGQNQSKAGDQWGFFQAKRIRGQILEGNADLLLAQKRNLFSPDTFLNAAQGMVKELRGAQASLTTPTPALEHEVNGVSKELKALILEAEKALADTRSAVEPPTDGWKGVAHWLNPKNVQTALDALQPRLLKDKKSAKKEEEAKAPIDTDQAALLKEIIEDIQKRKPESEIAPKVLKLTDETTPMALKEAEAHANEVYRRGKNIEKVLEEFDALAARQTALAFEFQQMVSRLRLLEKSRPGITQYRESLERRADSMRGLVARLQGDYKAARHAFSARRYEDDARSNQDAAYLYEVKVLVSSARSDKHLFRSKMFLFAMLVAQVGVTIATLAMAVKRKSIFWLLAALTGIIAIGFGAYVYLDLWPIPVF